MAGLTPTGFEVPTVAELLATIEAGERAALGADLDVSAETPLGQINAIIAVALRSAWEAEGAVYRGRDPRFATGDQLDAVVALAGSERMPATYSTVPLSVSLGAGVTLPAGSVAHVLGQPAARWVTTASVTNSSGSPAVVSVAARAETAGAVRAAAGSITEIASPSTGWTAVTNATDADVGLDLETDPALRLRLAEMVRGGGSAKIAAIRRALVNTSGVVQVLVRENATAYPVEGLPPHSVFAVVEGGTDLAVATALWNSKAGGIGTHGAVATTIVDDTGESQVMRFSRPAEVDCDARLTVTVDPALYPGDADLQADAAGVTEYQRIGAPLRLSDVVVAARDVPGVSDVAVELRRTGAPSWGTVNLVAAPLEILRLDSARVTVVRA